MVPRNASGWSRAAGSGLSRDRYASPPSPMDTPSPSSTASSSTAKKRTRASKPKVRTGCITCKIRRVKCDETKPACTRCTSTGRTCDGYEGPAPPRKKKGTATENKATQDLQQIYCPSPRSFAFSPSPLSSPPLPTNNCANRAKSGGGSPYLCCCSQQQQQHQQHHMADTAINPLQNQPNPSRNHQYHVEAERSWDTACSSNPKLRRLRALQPSSSSAPCYTSTSSTTAMTQSSFPFPTMDDNNTSNSQWYYNDNSQECNSVGAGEEHGCWPSPSTASWWGENEGGSTQFNSSKYAGDLWPTTTTEQEEYMMGSGSGVYGHNVVYGSNNNLENLETCYWGLGVGETTQSGDDYMWA